jgi:hypothetical protein
MEWIVLKPVCMVNFHNTNPISPLISVLWMKRHSDGLSQSKHTHLPIKYSRTFTSCVP